MTNTPTDRAPCDGCLRELTPDELRKCDCGAELCPDCIGYWGSHEHQLVEVKL